MQVTLPMLMGRKTDAVLTKWHAKDGDIVQKGTLLYEVEMPKLTSSKTAPATGRFRKLVKEGTRVRYGQAIAEIIE